MALNIEIISDVACPWCFIGKRRFDAALLLYRGEGRPAPRVSWRAYQLHPEVPAAGANREKFLARKYGEAGASRIDARVAAVGKQAGLEFAFEKISRQPNTLAAHILVALAGEYDLQSEMVEIFFNAHFVGGLDLSNQLVLMRLAGTAGIPERAARAALASAAVRKRIAAEEREMRKLGEQGAPLFRFNNTVVISGAQEPQTLLRAMLMSNGGEAVA